MKNSFFLIYISYIHGQLDAIPIALLFISLYFLFRSKLNYSAIFLACAMATKTVIIATLPMLLIFLFSQRLPSINILRFIALVIAVFILINSPYILSESFLSMVFNNQQQSKDKKDGPEVDHDNCLGPRARLSMCQLAKL